MAARRARARTPRKRATAPARKATPVRETFDRSYYERFYGNAAETERFFDTTEAGVAYANRPQGATTGAWPGYQAFGGWKGSGSTGKAAGSRYYVQQYLREQSQTRVSRASA